MRAIHERLVDHWKRQAVAPGDPVSAGALAAFETRHGVHLPADFRAYLLHADGMADFGTGCDDEGFSFWRLRRMKSIREEMGENGGPAGFDWDRYFVFADYLQWCWAYAIDLGRESATRGQVIHAGTLQPKIVAASFTEFVELYFVDSPRIYPDPIPESQKPPVVVDSTFKTRLMSFLRALRVLRGERS